jgi:hypothetical protein
MAQTLQASCTEDRERQQLGAQRSTPGQPAARYIATRFRPPPGPPVRQIESPPRVLRPLRTVATAAPPWRVRRAHCGQVKEAHRSGCSTPPSSRRWSAVRRRRWCPSWLRSRRGDRAGLGRRPASLRSPASVVISTPPIPRENHRPASPARSRENGTPNGRYEDEPGEHVARIPSHGRPTTMSGSIANRADRHATAVASISIMSSG